MDLYLKFALPFFTLFLFVKSACATDWKREKLPHGLESAVIEAKASFNGNTVPAKIRLICYSGSGLDINLQIDVLDTTVFSGFNFDDFEGPDAPFGASKLAQVNVSDGVNSTIYKSAGGGWFSEHNQFRFDIPLQGKYAHGGDELVSFLDKPLTSVSVIFHEKLKVNQLLEVKAVDIAQNAQLLEVLALCKKGKR